MPHQCFEDILQSLIDCSFFQGKEDQTKTMKLGRQGTIIEMIPMSFMHQYFLGLMVRPPPQKRENPKKHFFLRIKSFFHLEL